MAASRQLGSISGRKILAAMAKRRRSDISGVSAAASDASAKAAGRGVMKRCNQQRQIISALQRRGESGVAATRQCLVNGNINQCGGEMANNLENEEKERRKA